MDGQLGFLSLVWPSPWAGGEETSTADMALSSCCAPKTSPTLLDLHHVTARFEALGMGVQGRSSTSHGFALAPQLSLTGRQRQRYMYGVQNGDVLQRWKNSRVTATHTRLLYGAVDLKYATLDLLGVA